MYFCPCCSNLLLIEESNGNELYCQSCPYTHRIKLIKSHKRQFKRKVVDDILGAKDQWDNVDSTEVECPKCSHTRAFFMQIQIRSADEPSTLFYKCCECQHDWREN